MRPTDLVIVEHYTAPSGGWSLHLKCTACPARFRADRPPLLIVPGYGMNAFIFGYHPRGMSMERYLAEAGYEVWSVNLRRQGLSRGRPGAEPPSLRAYAQADLRVALEELLARTRTEGAAARRAVIIGCSLGGSIAYAHLALVLEHRVAALVAIGSPLRWVEVHPLLRAAFASPRLLGRLHFSGTRRLAAAVLPVLRHIPDALSIYMNARHVDLHTAAELARTVDDPHPRVNSDIAKWIAARDMVLGGRNITEAMHGATLPLLVVVANRDGIVPAKAALSVTEVWGSRDIEVLRIGDDRNWFAHADLYIADSSPDLVFAPITRWLDKLPIW